METNSLDGSYDGGLDDDPNNDSYTSSIENALDTAADNAEEKEDKRTRLLSRVMGIRAEFHAVHGVTSAEKGALEVQSKDLSEQDIDLIEQPDLELLSVKNDQASLSFNQFGVTITSGAEVAQADYAALSDEQFSLVNEALGDAAMIFFEE